MCSMYSAAVEFYRQALEIFESTYGVDSPEALKVSVHEPFHPAIIISLLTRYWNDCVKYTTNWISEYTSTIG